MLVYQIVAGVEYVVKLKDLLKHESIFGKLNTVLCPKVCTMVFDALFEAHVATEHATIYRTLKNKCEKYLNVSMSISSDCAQFVPQSA